jgi:cytochrome c biogenesis protein ResB
MLGFFRVFSAPWFLLLITILVIAIICCTLDRTPRLWRGVRAVTVEQPASFFDARLSDRAVMEHARSAGGLATSSGGAASRSAGQEDGRHVGLRDRNQYFKMATLLTHLAPILFLGGGAVTVAAGFETIVFVAEGQRHR